ncbi:MAG: hypothetical protein KAG53_04545 [Endozoicomonadaceae bacterium]|nr:hypothetical protein [Endozoicomonadaceae bacterium]
MDAKNTLLNQSSSDFVSTFGNNIDFGRKDDDINTNPKRTWTRTDSKNNSNKVKSRITDEFELTKLAKQISPIPIKERESIIVMDDSKEEDGLIDKSELNKSTDFSDSNEDYLRCKAEYNELIGQIKHMEKQLSDTPIDGDIQNKTKLGELMEKLDSVTESMEYHKNKIHVKKTKRMISHHVLNLLHKAIPEFQKSPQNNWNIRARLRSLGNSIKKYLTHKGLVKVLRIALVVLVAAAVFCAVNALFGGILLGFFSISVGLGWALFCPATGISLMLSIVASGSSADGVLRTIKHRDENEPLMEEINNLAQCLTTKGQPDIPTLFKLIAMMEDNSFLSGDSDYDRIYSDLITFFKTHPTLISYLIDRATEHDTRLVKKIRESSYDPLNTHCLSLDQVNEYYKLINTWKNAYKKNNYMDAIKKELVKKVVIDFYTLTDNCVGISTTYLKDHPLQFIKLQDDDDDGIILATIESKDGKIKTLNYDIDKLISYMEHMSRSFAFINLCKESIGIPECQQEVFDEFNGLYNHLHEQLLKTCPKYKKKQESHA